MFQRVLEKYFMFALFVTYQSNIRATIATMTNPVEATSPPSPPSPPPNFSSSNSCALPYPFESVFNTLATSSSMKPIAHLSSLTTSYTLGDTEPIAISSGSLCSAQGTSKLSSYASPDSLYRTRFLMEETVPILGGLFKAKVIVEGCQTEDREGRCCLYESTAQNKRITIRKLRTFEAGLRRYKGD